MSQQLSHEENAPVQMSDPAVTTPQQATATVVTPATRETRESEEIDEWLAYVSRPRSLPWAAMAAVTSAFAIPLFSWFYFILKTYSSISPGQLIPLSVVWQLTSSVILPIIWIWHILKVDRLKADTGDDAMLGAPDPRWIGPLVDALDAPNGRVRSAAGRQLARLLNNLKREDAAHFLPVHRRTLYRVVRRNAVGDSELIAATLKAIGRIGDTEAFSLVEQIADDRRRSPRRRYVRQVAHNCLARLDRRLDAESTDAGLQAGAFVVPQDPALEVAAGTEDVNTANNQVRKLIADLEQQRRKNGQPGMRNAFLIASWLTIVPYTGYQLTRSATHLDWMAIPVWGACFGFATQLHRYVLSSKRTEAAQKLAAYDDVQAVGLLAEALEWPDAEMQEVAKSALSRLLPRLRASDAGLLNVHQRAALYRQLRMGNAAKDQWFLLAILTALQQVGDGQAVPYVLRLAHSAALFAAQRKIKRAAEECLPFLNERAQQQRASQTLLRAAGTEGDNPNILLRPTGEITGADPTQLLRPGLTERPPG